MSMTVGDIEDPSDDKEEGGPGENKKRRKRMLSNRASAQRSRQRRQERLDTLEVLVAELRVENAALTRRAKNAVTTAKKLEEENTALRNRLSKQAKPVPLSDSNASVESDKTTENSKVEVNNKIGPSWRPDIGPPRNGSCINVLEESCPDNSLSRRSSGALTKRCGDEPVENARRWKYCLTSSSSDFDFNWDLMESATHCGTDRIALPDVSGGVNVRDRFQSAIMSLEQNQSSQGRDTFSNDLKQCYLVMEKSKLDSGCVEDVWMESLANCLK